MFVPHFLLGYTYRREVQGTGLKTVECEACSRTYHYRMVRKANGQCFSPFFLFNGWASEKAYRLAELALQKKLDREFEPIPCPECGWFQRSMVHKLRGHYLNWMRWLGWIGSAVAAFLAFINYAARNQPWQPPLIPWPELVVGASIFPLILVTRWILSRLYDPNATDHVVRIELGREYCIEPEEPEE